MFHVRSCLIFEVFNHLKYSVMIPTFVSAGSFIARYVHENSHGWGFEVRRLSRVDDALSVASDSSRVGIAVVVCSNDSKISGNFYPDEGSPFCICDLAELSVLMSRIVDVCYSNTPSAPPRHPGIDQLIRDVFKSKS